MDNIISSQRYTDDAIVAAKRAANDYTVDLVPLTYEGETWHLVADGHHSLAAAIADGVEPVYVVDPILTSSLVGSQSADDVLAQCYIDSDWYFADPSDDRHGRLVWA